MLFKVSFKDSPKNPSKVVVVTDRKMGVRISGTVSLPEFWKHLPEDIIEWMTDKQNLVSGEEELAKNVFYIHANGFARCHKEDKFDYVLGERIAEARAKYKIYKFFYNLTCRLYDYYNQILFGEAEVVDTGKGNCLAQDIKKYEALCIREAHHIGELLKENTNG